ncbi:MAG TPA: YicC/YloC family endoribonuclease, partial [Usitatibacter sp.]|nr:YicC/YloC family endoribonuclease [Usitatibacter sp.]
GDASRRVLERFPQARPLTVAEVLHWPGVLAEATLSPDRVREDLMQILDRALSELDQTRRREGAKLEEVLRERLARMSELVTEARPLVPGAVKAYQEKLAAKIAEAAASPSDERVHQEIVLYAARIDVDEEIARLGTHVSEFLRVMDRGGACGKRLDFLCQELNREANTLGSKSVASEMTRISVELKVLIEQMREQVQNIE